MNDAKNRKFTQAIQEHGVEWLLPQNLPDEWLDTIMQEDAAVLSKQRRGNYDALVYAVICLMEGKPVHMEDFGPQISKEYLSMTEKNMRFYVWVLAIEATARLERDLKMPHFIPAIPYLAEHPLTVHTIFRPETARRIRHIVDQGPIKNNIP